MAEPVSLVVRTAFGLEAVVARELTALGYADQKTEDGRIFVEADLSAIPRLNLWLRSAERVQIVVARFTANDFGVLFDRTKAAAWDRWIPHDASFPVTGRSVRSKLHSVPNCQRIVKKAVVESLRTAYRVRELTESGPTFPVDVSLVNNEALLTIDTSGDGLHKRGYRTYIGPAPLKETLAAALVQLSVWNPDRVLLDPVCGSGTIPIEAALIARNLAPGRKRTFLAEQWGTLDADLWRTEREAAEEQIRPAGERIIGTDMNGRILNSARTHAANAGVGEDIHFQKRPLSEASSPKHFGCLIANPPYGERIGQQEEVETLYREMGSLFERLSDWSFGVITSYPHFRRLVGRKATRRRKLYNGKIACTYYQYLGPKPPQMRKRHWSETTDPAIAPTPHQERPDGEESA